MEEKGKGVNLKEIIEEFQLEALYMGEGDVAWHAAAKSAALNEQMTAWYEEIATTYAVTINEKALNKIIR